MRTRGHDATDERDQIFAILGLVNNSDGAYKREERAVIVPDYEQDVSRVYQNAMVAIFRSTQNLKFLEHAPDSYRPELPSWCANFSKKNCNWEHTGSLMEDRESRGHQWMKDVVHDPETGVLEVAGGIIGTVQKVINFAYEDSLESNDEMEEGKVGYARRRYVDFMSNMMVATLIAHQALRSRFGEEEAVRRVAAGEIWQTVGKNGSPYFLVLKASAMAGLDAHEDRDNLPRDFS